MALYSTFKYGDGTKYGAGEQTANLRWGFIVAWDGFYGWGNEANRMVDLSVRRGRSSLIAAGGQGFAPFPPGEATVILDNSDGRFDPFNVSSPLYPNVAPGKFVRISIRDEANSANFQIMRGVISDIQPVKRRDTQQVRITIVDGLRWLKDRIIRVGLKQSITKSNPPDTVLNFADWPESEWAKSITIDSDIQTYWWAWNQNAYEALREWNTAESAVSFHSRDGMFVWRPRDYEHLRSTTLNQADLLDDIARPQPWEIVRNNVRVNVQTKILDPINDVIWRQRDTPAIAAGETFYVEPIFKYQEWQPCGAGIGFQFTVNTQADGGGADLSADCKLVFLAAIGEGARLWLTNNSGTDGFITLFTATGDVIYPPNVDWRESDDEASQASFGPRTLAINSRWIESSVDAQSMGDWILSELKDPSVQPIVQLEDQPTLQFTPDLWDRIILNAATLGISSRQYRVGQIAHQTTSQSCQGVLTTLRLEPYLQEGEETMSYRGVQVFTTGETITNNTATDVEWTNEDHDITAWHSAGTNPERVTVPAHFDGYYALFTTIQWEGHATGDRKVRIQKNGVTLREGIMNDTSEPQIFDQHVRYVDFLVAGDYITVEVQQTSGGDLDVFSASLLSVDFLGTG